MLVHSLVKHHTSATHCGQTLAKTPVHHAEIGLYCRTVDHAGRYHAAISPGVLVLQFTRRSSHIIVGTGA